MIDITFKAPTAAELRRAVNRHVEERIASKAKSAAARHGGVTVRFSRKADGSIQSVKLEG